MLSVGIDAAPQSFFHSFFCSVNDRFFEVGPEIRCLGVLSRGNHTAGSKAILKLLT